MAETFIPKNYVNKFFAAWDAVPKVPKSKSSRIAFKQSVVQRPIDKRSFLEAMQEMIDIFGAYFLGMMEKNTTVAEIFHLRLKIRKTVTSEEEIKHYTSTLRFFIEISTPSELSSRTSTVVSVLFAFVATHKLDLDNSLIGLPPSQSLLDRVTDKKSLFRAESDYSINVELSSLMRNNNSQSILIGSRRGVSTISPSSPPSSSNSTSTSSSSSLSTPSPSSSPPSPLSGSPSPPVSNREQSVDEEPSDNTDRHTVKLRSQMTRLRVKQAPKLRLQRISVGDLVLVIIQSATFTTNKNELDSSIKNKYCFARVAGYGDAPRNGMHQLYRVFKSPDERSSIVVSRDRILCLPAAIVHELANVRMMEKMVLDPTSRFFSRIQQQVRDMTLKFLAVKGANEELLSNSATRITLSEMSKIKQTHKVLEEVLQECPPSPRLLHNSRLDRSVPSGYSDTAHLFKELETFLVVQKDTFLRSHFDTEKIFSPSLQRILNDLDSFVYTYTKIAKTTIEAFGQMCSGAIDQLNLSKKEVIDGSIKESLTDWWLALINDSVDGFLTDLGYDHNAVPFDYIEVPPVSLEVVRNNLKLIQHSLVELKSKDGTGPAHQLINELKNIILPKIEHFIKKVKVVLCDYFNVAFEEFDLEKVKKLYKEKLPFFEPKLATSIQSMLQDLEYLNEMIYLEHNPKKLEKGKLELGVVPITGLIIGKMYRLENELLTVIDVWKNKSIDSPSSS